MRCIVEPAVIFVRVLLDDGGHLLAVLHQHGLEFAPGDSVGAFAVVGETSAWVHGIGPHIDECDERVVINVPAAAGADSVLHAGRKFLRDTPCFGLRAVRRFFDGADAIGDPCVRRVFVNCRRLPLTIEFPLETGHHNAIAVVVAVCRGGKYGDCL